MGTQKNTTISYRAHWTRAQLFLALMVLLSTCARPRTNPPYITTDNAADLQQIGDITITPFYASIWPSGTPGIAVIDDDRVHVYDLRTLTEQILPLEGTQTVTFTPSGDILAVGTDSGEITLWDVAGEKQKTLTGHTVGVSSIAISDNRNQLATLDLSKKVILWDLKTSRADTIIDLSSWPTVHSRLDGIQISPDGHTLAILAKAESTILKLWDIRAGEPLHTLKLEDSPRGFYDLMFSPDWDKLAWVSGGTVQMMVVDNGSVGQTLTHEDSLNEWVFSPDGTTFVTRTAETIAGNFTGVVKIWDADSGIARHTIAHSDFVSAMSFSPDWQHVVTAAGFGEIRIWHTGTGQETALLSGHTDTVWALAYSADGEMIASASETGHVQLWDTHNGNTLANLSGPNATLIDVSFSRNGDWIAAVSDDGNITLWGISD